MRFLFIVQGEGRGHMTQAMALYDMLRNADQEVCQVIIGSSSRRAVPPFVLRKFTCPVQLLESPNFVTDKNLKSIRLGQTIWQNVQKLPVFLKSLKTLDSLVSELQPDIIVNFYEFLAGIYHTLYRPRARFICIGHQYLAEHASFTWAPGSRWNKHLFLLANRITSWGADQRIALSLQDLCTDHTQDSLTIWPPLLREQVLNILPKSGDYLLVYIVNPGYLTEIRQMATRHPLLRIEVFSDQAQIGSTDSLPQNMQIHTLDDQKFISYMAGCRGLVCTAGFESISEALYLGKPVMVVPVSGQYEQACNALETKISGAGIFSKAFDLEAFIDYLPNHPKASSEVFRVWYAKQPSLFHHWLSEMLSKPTRIDHLATMPRVAGSHMREI